MATRTRKRFKRSNLITEQDTIPVQTSIHSEISELCIPTININATWAQNGLTIAGGNGSGSGLNQLSYPWDMCIDDDETVYISEYSNQRVVEWKRNATNGHAVAGGKKQGNRTDQLNGPANVIIDRRTDSLIIADQGNRRVVRWPHRNGRKGEIIISDIDCWGLAMDSRGYLYVSDYKTHEVKRWHIGDPHGSVVAGGHGKGDLTDQLHFPAHIFVDENHSLYISDIGNHRVMKWMEDAKEGIIVASGSQLAYPSGLAVDQRGTVYIVDSQNHRVMRWFKGATQGSVIIGGKEKGREADQLNGPVGLAFDRHGHLYVADNLNHRLQKFTLDACVD